MLDSRRNVILACALSALAGHADAIGFLRGPRCGWAPNLLLWAALVAGSLCGAAAYHWINLAAIWFAAAGALALSASIALNVRR
jgi:uncharacterized membrane protein YoaK (UPF0700 family)